MLYGSNDAVWRSQTWLRAAALANTRPLRPPRRIVFAGTAAVRFLLAFPGVDDHRRRWWAAALALEGRCTAAAVDVLASHPNALMRSVAATAPNCPPGTLARLAVEDADDPGIMRSVVSHPSCPDDLAAFHALAQ